MAEAAASRFATSRNVRDILLTEAAASRFATNTRPSDARPNLRDIFVLRGKGNTCGLQAIALGACQRGRWSAKQGKDFLYRAMSWGGSASN